MINLSDLKTSKQLVILRGEYGIVQEGNLLAAAPNAKSGIIIILFSQENQMLAMAHVDSEDEVQKNLAIIFDDMLKLANNISSIRCSLMGHEIENSLEKKVRWFFEDLKNKISFEVNRESWSGDHSYNIVADTNGEILIDNSSDLMRFLVNQVLFTNDGEKRVGNAMSSEAVEKLALVKT